MKGNACPGSRRCARVGMSVGASRDGRYVSAKTALLAWRGVHLRRKQRQAWKMSSSSASFTSPLLVLILPNHSFSAAHMIRTIAIPRNSHFICCLSHRFLVLLLTLLSMRLMLTLMMIFGAAADDADVYIACR